MFLTKALRPQADDFANPYVGREKRAVQFRPIAVEDFGSALDGTAKIVGVCNDYAHLVRCESEARGILGDQASVARSQIYYLEAQGFTDPENESE